MSTLKITVIFLFEVFKIKFKKSRSWLSLVGSCGCRSLKERKKKVSQKEWKLTAQYT